MAVDPPRRCPRCGRAEGETEFRPSHPRQGEPCRECERDSARRRRAAEPRVCVCCRRDGLVRDDFATLPGSPGRAWRMKAYRDCLDAGHDSAVPCSAAPERAQAEPAAAPVVTG